MCLCTSPNAYCKPTERAKKYGHLLYYIMFILIVLMICGFIGGYFQLSILAIFLIITGWCSVRNDNVYNIEQILCVVFFSGYILVYTTVDVILKIIAYRYDLPIFVLISLFGGVIFYSAACIIGKILYDELRMNYSQVLDPNLSGPSFLTRMMGGGNRQTGAQRVADNDPSAEEMDPFVQNNRGNIQPNGRGRALGSGAGAAQGHNNKQFKPFSGSGHALNE